MVITRSHGDAADAEDTGRSHERRGTAAATQEAVRRQEAERVERERLRRLSLDPPASPAVRTTTETSTVRDITTAGPSDTQRSRRRVGSPTRSAPSQRSATSVTTRMKIAELEAAEKLAAIKRRELELEADLVKKRLAAEVSAIQDEEEEPLPSQEDHQHKVDEWLRTNPLSTRGEVRFDAPRTRSPTPPRRNSIEYLAATLEKMSRPRLRCADLPTFSGAVNEWLPFKAAVRDTTNMYQVSSAENIQRLRSCLKGEARDTVAALLHSATDPDVIMKTLEQCFGRPEIIIDQALSDIKKLPRLGATAAELNSFAIKLQNIVCVLKTMDRKGYLFNPLLTREILEKLSPHLRARWCDYAFDNEGSVEPEIITMSRFLVREADRALRYAYVQPTCAAAAAKRETRPAVTLKKRINVYNTTADTEEEKIVCIKCNQEHVLTQCPKYKALTVEQRWELLKENKICFKCAQKKHRRINCKAKLCGVNQCRRPHHETLHKEGKPVTTEPITSGPPKEEAVLSVATRPNTGPRSVLLKMCPVIITGPRGEARTYALLDEGSTVTLIDEDLAASIGAEGPSQPLNLRGVNMSQQETKSHLVTIQVKGLHEDQQFNMKARTLKNLKLHPQAIPNSVATYEHLQGLSRDEVCYDMAHPGLLVGTDHWECIVSRELRVGKPDEPAASKTHLGWVVHGTAPRSIIVGADSVLHVYEPCQLADQHRRHQELHELVEAHFKIEALGVSHKLRVTEADQRAMNIVENTIKKIDGGYEVGLPWKQAVTTMPPSYGQALRRLTKIEQRMDTDREFAKEYTAQVENLLKKGYAVPCDGSERSSAVCWYLPHFAVHNPNKPGKQRLVFDAAARSYGTCLNDKLLEGPDLLLSLPGILFRFREKAIAVTADIQEMFLRIKIRKEDQPAQQFLWRGCEREKPPQLYKMTSMIFGAVSSPYMAHYVRNHNAHIYKHKYPLAFDAITKSHYMDDLAASYADSYETQKAIEEIITVHTQAGFTMRGWSCNDRDVLSNIPIDLHATSPTHLGGVSNKILGLHWNAERDELGFNTQMSRVPAEIRARTRAPTKREALSAVMSIFDPLGLLSHYTIRAKIILQSLWRLHTSWDEAIPEEQNELFAAWILQLEDIAQLKLPRCYLSRKHECIELHILCDASEQAYATVAYWKITYIDGAIDVVLVGAKAKVAPRKALTIPRLELQAAVIGARLADTIRREHGWEINKTRYWTDSSTVIQWIYNDMTRYTPFVAHRLGEIAELTRKEEWRWLPTKHNVADDATRLNNTPICTTDRWFTGPNFLYLPEEQWPSRPTCNELEDEVLHVSEGTKRDSWLPDPARFSKYEVLVRAAARALAFIDICRRKATCMEHHHIERAERELIQRAQRESFEEDITRIRSARPLTKTSRLYQLDPVIEDGVLKIRGRIGAATVPSETKRPIILDGRHQLTKLLVLREHCAAGHANRERVTNDLRQRYWVIHLRPTVRAIERSCTFCKKRRATPQTPVKGDLPHARLDPFHRPFTNCGVDYFGPMTVKIGRRREKRWGALFTCLTSRAVHIELVASLSTDSAIMALRRMAARRGWPQLMYSDNATNFRGADQELRRAYTEWTPALKDEGLLHRMEWRYIPPGAPNQGGAWERMVRSVKAALGITLREKAPSEEVLSTLLTEAEFAINARPLTHVSVDPRDPEALTPNHFLLGSSTGLPTTGPCDEADRRAWKVSQALADHFWRRWLHEYLPTLVPRGESSNNVRPQQVGDVVIVVDSTLPRNVWPIGIIERTHPGPDGGIRVVEVRTRTGIFRRPVSKIVTLQKKEEATQAAPGGEM